MFSEIKVFSFSFWQKVQLAILLSFLSLFFFSYIYTFTFIGVLVGSLLLYFLIYLTLTSEKYILFLEDDFEIITLTIRLKFSYSEIEKLQFFHPSKDYPRLNLRLKERHLLRKNFTISVKNPREKLRDILNHANSKGVKTALNKVGEDYLVFNTDEGNYSVKEVKYNKY